MTELTLERCTPSGDMWQESFLIVNEFEHGFDVRKPKGKKIYAAVRNQKSPNWISILDGRGGHVFQGMIVE